MIGPGCSWPCRWRGVVAGFVLSTMLPGPSIAVDIVGEVSERYQQEAGVSGQFKQTLRSNQNRSETVYKGSYQYSPSQGLTWEVTSPSNGRLVVRSNGEAEASGELGGLSLLEKRTVGRLIVAMVALDTTVLDRYYTIEQTQHASGFEIRLDAKPGWRRQVGTVIIRGRRLVEEVRMRLPDGRTMELSLTHGD
jgi:hypothetical protein